MAGTQLFEPTPAASQGTPYQKAGMDSRDETLTQSLQYGMWTSKVMSPLLYQTSAPIAYLLKNKID